MNTLLSIPHITHSSIELHLLSTVDSKSSVCITVLIGIGVTDIGYYSQNVYSGLLSFWVNCVWELIIFHDMLSTEDSNKWWFSKIDETIA